MKLSQSVEATALEVVLQREGQASSFHAVEVGQELVVGRDPECQLVLVDDLVSRRHAVLRIFEDGVEVEDTSTNGTMADGVVLKRQRRRVALGKTLAIGASVLVVRAKGQTGATQTRPIRLVDPARVTPSEPVQAGALNLTGAVHSTELVTAAQPAGVAAQANPAPLPNDADAAAREGATSQERGDGAPLELRREIHRLLLEHLDMNAIDPTRGDDPALRPRVLTALRRIVRMLEARLPPGLSPEALVGDMADEALGLGPLERLLADPSVSEVMVIDAHNIYVERNGRLTLSDARFTDEERVRAVIERIVTPLGRRIDESSPLVDARLADGSRVNVVIRPLALRGSCITIRKFARTPLTLDKLVEFGAMSEQMGRFLTRSVKAKKNIVIAGGTGSGKTTLLNVLSAAIPEDERIVTIEDAAELKLSQPHVVALESRPANMEGKGEIAIRELVKNALRMRPDRIVVGECRGGEALDMLQAMNTGHDGSLTTTHANSPVEALMRLETLSLMAGLALPPRAIREQIAKSIHLLVQQSRLSDGSRKVTAVAELCGLDPNGNLRLRTLFELQRLGVAADGSVLTSFQATGYLPSYLPELLVKGLVPAKGPYL
jgi:pilus assembly protein CpaF